MKYIFNIAIVCLAVLVSCESIDAPGTVPDPEKEPVIDTTVVDDHVSNIPGKDVAVNIGAKETANCYVVTAPGTYSFKAVKGNSTESIGAIASVSVLWETFGTTETVTPNSIVAEVDYENDLVYFRIDESFHPGNAVIAAKGADGNIMWSWHIWVPETEIAADLYGLSRRKSMSRNLGALVDASADGASPKSAGLLYQWGRKDPFVGVGDFTTGQAAAVAGVAMTKSGGQMTVEESVKSPTVFADNNGSWTSSTDKLWNRTKTIYDPCPAGYRLPYDSEYLPLAYGPSDWDAWTYDQDNIVFTVGSPAAVFPLSGYLSYDGSYKGCPGTQYLWSSRASGVNAYSFGVDLPGNDDINYVNSLQKAANGYSVRCLSNDLETFENAEGTPVKGAYEKYVVNMQELSGLCLHTDGSFLWAVGDQGVLAKVGFDASMEKVFTKSHDMESVTIDPETGDLYLGCEPNYVYRIPAPDYNRSEEVFRVADASGYGNSGIEGISWYKDGLILVGTQVGAYMWAYRLDGTPVWRKSMCTVAMGMKEIADICYDPVKDQIWIIDSETQSIYLFNGDATEHLATYKVSYGGNCESLYIDYANSCIWMGDDTDESKLFKIAYEF